jgi:hypothetical protein
MAAYEIRLTCGLVVRGPADAIQGFFFDLDGLFAKHSRIRVIRREISDQPLHLELGRVPPSATEGDE